MKNAARIFLILITALMVATFITLLSAATASAKPLGEINGKSVSQPKDAALRSADGKRLPIPRKYRGGERSSAAIQWTNKPKGWKPSNPAIFLRER